MPHIKQEERKEIDSATDTFNLSREGQLCYVFSKWAKDTYSSHPRWSTIHKIKFALRNPFHNDETHALIQKFMGNWHKEDVFTAADLAFTEFYRRVGALYEDGMIEQNGDVFAGVSIPSKLGVAQATEVKRGRGRPKKTEAANA